MNQQKVAGQVQFGKGCEDAAEKQQGERHDQHHGQQFIAQNITDIFDAFKINQNPPGNDEYAAPEKQTE